MTRLIWYALILAVVGCVAAGVSWVMAYTAVNDILGAPPPDMGTTKTTFLWEGMPRLPGHPRAWRFAFSGTHVAGAPNVRIYVSPMGRLLQTEPGDFASRVKTMHGKGFN